MANKLKFYLKLGFWKARQFFRKPKVKAISIALLVLVMAVEVWGLWDRNYSSPNRLSLAGWETYENQQYGFRVQYPSGWQVAEFLEGNVSPAFNIYKTGADADESKLPFTHFSNATHVSIYPHGIPTEGVSSENRDSVVETRQETRIKKDFLLVNGNPWASIFYFEDIPGSWRDWGFVWIGLFVSNESFDCLRENRAIPIENCDPLTGDNLIRYGKTSGRDRDIEEKIISTFEFIK